MRISDWSSDGCSSDLFSAWLGAGNEGSEGNEGNGQPTAPSSEPSSSFLASTANSIGSSRKTCLQKPSTIIETASSSPLPRLRQSNRWSSQIGRASCMERVCQYVSISVVALTLKKQQP